MKKFLAVIAIASLAIGCDSKSEKKTTEGDTTTVAPLDTTTTVTPTPVDTGTTNLNDTTRRGDTSRPQ